MANQHPGQLPAPHSRCLLANTSSVGEGRKAGLGRLQDSKIQGIPQMWTLLYVHLLVASLTGLRAFEISIRSVFML